jgi:hypothetical protein
MEPIATLYHRTSRTTANEIAASGKFQGNGAFTPQAAAAWEKGGDEPGVLELEISWEYGETWGENNRRFHELVPAEVIRVLTLEEARAGLTIER